MANGSTITVTLRAVADISDVLANAKQIQKAFDQIAPHLGSDLQGQFKSVFGDLEKEIAKIQSKTSKGIVDKKDIKEIEKSYNTVANLLNQIQTLGGKISSDDLSKAFTIDNSKIDGIINKIKEAQQALQTFTSVGKDGKTDFEGFDKLLEKYNLLISKSQNKKFHSLNLGSLIGDFKAGDLSQLDSVIKKMKSFTDMSKQTKEGTLGAGYQSIILQLEALQRAAASGEFGKILKDISSLIGELQSIKADAFKEFVDKFQKVPQAAGNLGSQVRNMGQGFVDASREALQFNENLDRMSYRLKYFFGIENAINLVKRAVRSAYQSVTELDKAMTATAVVTNFTVGDMWEKLPEYTKMANKLGATTQGAYETSTLYYQQGLNTAQVMAISTETMKMARIAGMEYADATNMMTAALRGFNMAINEQSATRVNDVYSELAAITAADTNQIATAMTKTASIAASANMEFETTAAFLSQIIETTQEAPETAGTALKTIIARFTEVKKLYSEGDLLGQDEEGEAIDVNKIQTALRSIGISMTEFFRGEEGLDDVLLRLAEKWDTLDLTTQRYIATTAAGSRQQSRFLAMMGNYDRTMELVEAANNSAGASQEQFDKTLESLESKVNQLNNAWQAFTMSLADDGLIKGAVDSLTALLNAINGITDAFGKGSGIMKLLLAGGLFKLGTGLVGGLRQYATDLHAGTGTNRSFAMGMSKAMGWGTLAQGQGLWQAAKSSSKWRGGGVLGLIPFTSGWNRSTQVRIEDLFNSYIDQYQKSEEYASRQAKIASLQEERTQLFNKSQNVSDEERQKLRQEDEAKEAQIKNLQKEDEKSQNNLMQEAITQAQLQNYQKMGQAVTVLAGAFALLGNAADKAGLDGLAKVFNDVAKAAGIVGPLLMTLPPILTAITGSAIAAQSAMLPILLITGVIIAAIGTIKLLDAAIETDAEKVERLKESSEGAQQDAQAATEAYEELLNGKTQHEERLEALKKLTQGTQEYLTALAQANAETAAFAEKFGIALTVQDGILSWTDADYNSALEKYNEQQIALNSRAVVAQGAYTEAQSFLKMREAISADSSSWFMEGIISPLFGDKQASLSNYFETDEQGLKGFITKAGRFSKIMLDLVSKEFLLDLITPSYQVEGLNKKFFTRKSATKAMEKAFKEGNSEVIKNNSEAYANYQNSLAQETAYIQSVASGHDLQSTGDSQVDDLFLSTLSTEIAEDVDISELGQGHINIKKWEEKYLSEAERNSEEYLGLNKDQKKARLRQAKAQQELDGIIDDRYSELLENYKNLTDEEKSLFKNYGELKGSDISKAVSKLESGNESAKILAKAIKKSYNKEYTSAMTSLADIFSQSSFITSFGEDGKNYLENFKTDFSLNQLQELSRIGGELTTSLGEDGAANLIIDIADSIKELGPEFEKSLSNINFNNIFSTLDQLTLEANRSSSEIRDELLSIRNQMIDELGPRGFFDLLISSEEYSEIEDQVKQFVETNGEVTAQNIQEIANEFKILDELIETGALTSGTLAEVLNGISTGDYSLDSLSASLLEALNIATSLESTIANGFDFIDNYQKVRSEGELGDFVADLTKGIMDSFEVGRFGDSTTKQSITTLFGEQKGAAYNQFLSGIRPDMTDEEFWGLFENTLGIGAKQMIASISEEGDLSAWWDYQANQALPDSMLSKLTKNEDGSWNFSKIFEDPSMTTDKFINQLVAETGISKDFANVLIGEAQAYGYGDQTGWKQLNTNDLLASIQHITSPGNELPYTLSDINKLFQASGLTEEEFNQLETGFIAKDGQILATQGQKYMADDWAGSESTAESRRKALDEYYEGKLTGVLDEAAKVKVDGKEEDQYSYDRLTTEFQKTGMTEKQAQENALEYVQGLDEAAGLYKELVDSSGELYQIELDKNATVEENNKKIEEGIAAHERELRVAEMTEAITSALEKSFISFFSKLFGIDLSKIFSGLKQGMDDSFKQPTEAAIEVTGENEAINAVQKVLSILAQIPMVKTVSILFSVASGIKSLFARHGKTGSIENSIPGFAKGKPGRYYQGIAQVGEEGQELVVGDNGAYLAGVKGPTFTYLNKNDTVYTAQETKKILQKAQGMRIPGFSRGTPGGTYGGGRSFTSGSGSSGGSKKGGEWDNPYDELYNLTEKINEALRDREKLERQYDRLLKDRNASYTDLIRNTLDSMANLRKEIALQQALQAGRARQLENIGQYTYRDKNKKEKTFAESGVMQYAQYNSATGLLEIDWEGIEAVTDENKGAAIEAYISKLEELVEQYEETEKTIADMEDTLEEIRDRGKEQYLEFEDRIYEALVEREQKLIDEYEDISNTINDSNSRILDGLRESIDLSRQIRDNTQTEEDIADKEARLAYLRRDTSGANQLEIQQLEEELKEMRQSYSDLLVDQELDRLNQVNETANEQRERQIEIANAQLEWLEQSGYFWDETYALLKGAFNEDGTLNNNSALVNLLKETDGFKGMSAFGSYDWIVKLIQEFNEAESGYSSWMLDKAEDQGYIEGTSVGKLTYDKESGKWTGENGKEYTAAWNAKKNDWDIKEVKVDTSTKPGFESDEGDNETEEPRGKKPKGYKGKVGSLASTGTYGLRSQTQIAANLLKNPRISTNKNLYNSYLNMRNKEPDPKKRASQQQKALSAYKKWKAYEGASVTTVSVYATGGLNTRIGPAWLDGTPSRPEYVLNADQTAAFLQLADVLPALMSNNSISTSTSSGDNYFDININVDSISSDYDVDRLTERIKQNIYEDGAYRNVNVINRLR